MRNIFILKTDKPSRLFYNAGGALLYTTYQNYNGVNLYITSDEEIKDGEYGICLNLVKEGYKSHLVVFKMDTEQRHAMEMLGGQKKAEILKVILTTDQKLIVDNVQAIDDEFLEWFRKNPNCEKVGVKIVQKKLYIPIEQLEQYKSQPKELQSEHSSNIDECYTYKIITPQEKSNYVVMLTQEQIEAEIIKCKESPYYFATTYLTVLNHKGEYVKLQTPLTEEEFNNKFK